MMNKKTTQQKIEQEVKTMKKVVIYIRHTEGCPRPSIEEQRNACRKYAAEHGCVITKEYIDCSSGAERNRDAFAKMIHDSKKEGFQGVLVYSIDRFLQDAQTLVFYTVALKKSGVDLISVIEPYHVDPSMLLMENLLQAFAEYYRLEQSEKIKRGIRLAKERKAALAAAEKQAVR